MAHFDFHWNEHNVAKLESHGLTPEETEEVVENPHRLTTSRSSGRPLAFGMTTAGRFIAVVYEMIDPVTAYVVTAYDLDDE